MGVAKVGNVAGAGRLHIDIDHLQPESYRWFIIDERSGKRRLTTYAMKREERVGEPGARYQKRRRGYASRRNPLNFWLPDLGSNQGPQGR